MSEPLREKARGKWRELLPRFGIDAKLLSGKHGPCPACGGTDRFRFDNKDHAGKTGYGNWICNQCGAGDGFKLLEKAKGWSFAEAAREIEPIVGQVKAESRSSRKSNEDWIKRLNNDLWSVGQALAEGDPVSLYLGNRGIKLPRFPRFVRYVEHCRYKDEGYHPAMVAKFLAPDGTPSTLHKTYLAAFGAKADVPEPRLLMPGTLAKGGAIRLTNPAPTLGIAEGIETALSATQLFSVPCWASLNAGLLMAWQPPPEAKEIVIFADNDMSGVGQQAAWSLYARLHHAGFAVRVEMPPDVDTDWNDALKAEAA
jgi:putative DNA primase/helicase